MIDEEFLSEYANIISSSAEIYVNAILFCIVRAFFEYFTHDEIVEEARFSLKAL